MLICHEKNTALYHNMKTGSKSFKSVGHCTYLETTLTNQIELGKCLHHLVQNLLFSGFLSKNVKIKIYRTIILPVVLFRCKTWYLTYLL